MITGRNFLEVYPKLLDAVQEHNLVTAPRGQEVVEHNGPVTWTIERPWEYALCIPGRRLNPFFALAEVVWMWSGKGGIDFISYYNKSMKNFADDGVPYFNAAYGMRVRHAGYSEHPFREIPYLVTPGQSTERVDIDQLDYAIKKIKADPDTRQAAISLWDPVKDNITKSKDHPCNNMVYLSQREGKLNITVVIRSNDLIWGVPYNMIQFVHLQALVAGELGVTMGSFTVMCNNLHYYKDLYTSTLKGVIDWNNMMLNNRVSVKATSDAFHKGWDSSSMIWDLSRFDGFVRNVWDPLEKQLRNGFESGAIGAWYNVRLMALEESFAMNHVPHYWQAVFTVMFMFHLRKANAIAIFDELLEKLPPTFKWLIEDFNKNVKE